MSVETPMKAIHNHLLFTKNGHCWAYYLVSPNFIHEGNVEKAEEHKDTMLRLMDRLSGVKDLHFQLFPSEMKIEQRMTILERSYDPKMRHIGRYYNQRTLDVLKDELINITENTFIVGVRLSNMTLTSETGIKDTTANTFANITNQLLNWVGIDMGLDDRTIASYEANEHDVTTYLQTINGKPMTEEMLYYLTRYSFIRGLPHSYEQEVEDRSKNISDTVLDTASDVGYLKINYDYGESYASILPISRTPDNMEGLEFFSIAQQFYFPVEFHLKLKRRNKSQTKNKISSTSKTLKVTGSDMLDNDDEDEELMDGLDQINHLKNQVNNHNTALFDWMGCFVVTGKTKEECFERAKTIRETMRDYQCRCVQPQADQLTLFYKLLHGQALEVVEPYWLHSSTKEGLSEFQFGVSQKLGSNIGQYIGRITAGVHDSRMDAILSSRFLVFLHAFLANEGVEGSKDNSPHIALTGKTGTGKSFLATMLMFYLMFIDGQILMTDPKSEKKAWFDLVKHDPYVIDTYPYFIELINQITFVTLNPDDVQNHGVLDPLTFLEGASARDNVLSILETIFPQQTMAIENEMRRELDFLFERKAQGERVGLMMLVETMRTHTDIQIKEFGENMFLKIKDSILQLIFSDGTKEPLRIDNKATILQIEGLELPDSKTKTHDLSELEIKNVAVMMSLSKYCQFFGMRNKSKKTSIFFDEAWVLTKAKGGKALVKSLRRVGRTYNNQLVLITQSTLDISNEDDTGNFGLSFAFDESSERSAILKHMELEDSQENKELLMGLKQGQCIMKDIHGRVGQLSVDCPFEEWTMAFQTVDKSEVAELETTFNQ